jgi:hypothetical protein
MPNIVGRITTIFNGAGIQQANAALTQMQQNAARNWSALGTVGRQATVAGAAITGAFSLALKAAIDFERGMAGIAAVTYDVGKSAKANAADMAVLSDQMKELATTTPISVKELISLGRRTWRSWEWSPQPSP